MGASAVRQHLPLALLLGVVVRAPFWVEALRTPLDADTAIVGLMARHLGRGATMWGQPYGSPLEAWLAAPFLAVMGTRAEALRLCYFLLGLALIPIAYFLARRLDPRAALPAAILVACPPPYFLLLSALPPPMYPSSLALGGVVLVLALRVGDRLAAGQTARGELALAGVLAGLAAWTHLMSLSVVAAAGGYLLRRARGRRVELLHALVPFLLASAPWWTRALVDRQATRVVSVSGREEGFVSHLVEVVPRLPRPLGGLLGIRTPWIADDPEHATHAPPAAAAAIVLLYGASLVLAARASRASPPARLLLAASALVVAVFPFPIRSGPDSIRFLTPLYLPLAALVGWAGLSLGRPRRAWILVLALACLHLALGSRLLAAWRDADRAAAPFLLADLGPVRRLLEERAVRRAYASYGPAYRLTFESGERIIASQPWNERFLHYPLPYLDEVRFAKNVAWVLTPRVPADLPAPADFEAALGAAGGHWRRTAAGEAVVFHDFAPPFGPTVEPLSAAGPAGDADLATILTPSPTAASTWTLPSPRPLDAITLVAGLDGPRLLRSMDLEVSADGAAFETVGRRRRRDERSDLRWVNGQPQYVVDHDVIAVPLGGRAVAAVRVTPVESGDAWGIGEILLHPAEDPSRRRPWDEWLDPNLTWAERRRALRQSPRPDREDWYSRLLLAARAR
jgi:4-amino-4-deoxy-L-arabinose transferase-like glycosyltransferase